MSEIQKNVVRRAERNGISRRLHAKGDEKAITAWKSDLDVIRRIFDVGLFISRWRSLTFRSQTELEMNADTNVHPVVPNVNHGPAHPPSSVPEIRGDLGDARNTVSITQRNTLNIPGDADGQNRTVCTTRFMPITEQPLIPVQSYARSEIPDQ